MAIAGLRENSDLLIPDGGLCWYPVGDGRCVWAGSKAVLGALSDRSIPAAAHMKSWG